MLYQASLQSKTPSAQVVLKELREAQITCVLTGQTYSLIYIRLQRS